MWYDPGPQSSLGRIVGAGVGRGDGAVEGTRDSVGAREGALEEGVLVGDAEIEGAKREGGTVKVGIGLGDDVRIQLGDDVGTGVGVLDGLCEGIGVGVWVEGGAVGWLVGARDGGFVAGAQLGTGLGAPDGDLSPLQVA